MSATLGLFAPLPAKPGQQENVEKFLRVGHSLLENEPATKQWYAVRYDTKDAYAIFDTFEEESGRKAHLNGQIADALNKNYPSLFEGTVDIHQVKVIASKVQSTDVSVGLRVLLDVKTDKVDEVKAFLEETLPLVKAETTTAQWYAFQVEGTNKFVTVAFFAGEAERQAHFEGEVAKISNAKREALLGKEPAIEKLTVIASRVL